MRVQLVEGGCSEMKDAEATHHHKRLVWGAQHVTLEHE